MAYRTQPASEELDGETNAFVWSVVQYLDSPTDYRECLPGADRLSSLQPSELVLLDDRPQVVRSWLRCIALVATMVCVILLIALRS